MSHNSNKKTVSFINCNLQFEFRKQTSFRHAYLHGRQLGRFGMGILVKSVEEIGQNPEHNINCYKIVNYINL